MMRKDYPISLTRDTHCVDMDMTVGPRLNSYHFKGKSTV